MAADPLKNVIHHLYQLAARAELQTLSDRELLQRYVTGQDEMAFGLLARRHGTMVWNVCWRVLGHRQDTEDAVQAAFLILIRKANSLRQGKEPLGGWLYKVAYHVATKAQVARERQRTRDERRAQMQRESYHSPANCGELAEVLDRELMHLAKKYRHPLVLCHLEGLTWQQAATELGITLRCLERRLSRGRELLRQRLTKRDWTMSDLALSTLLPPAVTHAELPSGLLAAVTKAAQILAQSRHAAETGLTAQAALLAKEILWSYALKTKVLVALLMLSLTALGGGVISYSGFLSQQGAPKARKLEVADKTTGNPAEKAKPVPARTDCYGDPLPPGALARLGTVRFRPGSGITSFAFIPDGKGVKPGSAVRGVLGITSLAFTPDGKGLLTAAYRNGLEIGKPISLWERDTGKLLRRFGDFPNFCSAAIGANGRIVAGWQAVHPTSHPGHPEDILCLWEVTTGKLLNQFKGKSIRRHYAVSPNGKFLATDLDGKFGIWDIDSGKPLWERKFRGLDAVAISPDSSIVALSALKRDKNGSLKNIICFWEARTGKLLRTREDDSEKSIFNVTNLVFSCDGNKLAVQSYNNKKPGMIHLLDRITGKVTLLGESEAGMVCSPTNMMVATYKNEGGFCLWDMNTGKKLCPVADFRPGRQRNPLVFSSDGKILAGTVGISERESMIAFWDVATGKELRRCQDSSTHWGALAFSPDGKILAAMQGPVIYCWEVASGKKLPQPQEPEDFIGSVAFTPDGKSLMSVGHLGRVYFWDVPSGQRRLTFSKGEHASYHWDCGVTLSPDGKIIATVGRDDSKPKKQRECIFLRDAATGRILQRLDDPKDDGEPGTCVFSPDGRFLACPWHSKANSYEVLLWEVATRKWLPQRFSGWAPAFSSDSTLLVSQNVEKGGYVFYIFDIATGKRLCTRAEEFWVRYGSFWPVCFSYVAFSPDDRALLALVFNQHDTNQMKLKQYPLYRIKPSGISVGKPRIIASYEDKFSLGYGSNQPIMGGMTVGALAISPDGKLLASVNGEGRIIHVWETATGKERCRFQGHNDQIHCLAFSPDGRRLASCSDDTTVLVWDITGRLKDKERLAPIRLSAKQMEEHWADLTGADAKRAHQSIWTLVAAGQSTVAFLAKQLRPLPVVVTAKVLDQLIADLENNGYPARQKARRQLEALGELAEPSLRQALEKQPSLELRRSVDHLLTLIEDQRAKPSGATLRMLRAIEVLEQIGSPEARKLLETLSRGAPGARQTQESQEVFERGAHRTIR